LSQSQIVSAYGPDEAQRMIAKLHTAAATYHAVQRTALTSPAEDNAALTAMAPSGAGFADQAHAQGVLQRVVSQKWAAITRDPAGYVFANSPGLNKLAASAGNDTAKMAGVAEALDHAYDQLGLPTYQRPLLPAATAGDLVSQILSAPPEARGQKITDTLKTYGDLAPRVMGDLVAQKLPPAYELVAALPNSADRTLMASAIGKAKEIRDGLPSGAAKQIDDALSDDANLHDLARSLSYAPGGAQKAGDIVEALKPMAYSLVQQGLSPTAAAARASAAITSSKYDFWEQSGGNVARVPRGSLAATETAADHLLSSLAADGVRTPANPSGVNLTDDQLRAVALNSARRGYWVTNESDSSLVRMGDNGVPVMLASGKRLELPFARVHEVAATAQTPNGTANGLGSLLGLFGAAPPAPVAP
jgi:hypothetical protein